MASLPHALAASHQRFDLSDHLAGSPEPQLGVDSVLLGGEMHLSQPGNVPLGEFVIGEVLERVASPEAQCVLEFLPRLGA